MDMMKPPRVLRLGLALALLGTSSLALPFEAMTSAARADTAAPASKVLATVNGKPITQKDLDTAMDDLGASLPQQLQGKARESYVLDYLIDGQLVVQKAVADKLDKTPEFADKLAYLHDKALMEIVLENIAKTATSEDNLKKTYDEAAKAQKPEEEIHARHILVPTEAEAQAALKRVKAGEDFAKVAKEVSKDPGSEGGDLGWFTKDRMVPEFAEAAFKLKDGEISDPVKSQFGWHIIQVEGHREKSFPPFDEVKPQIVKYVVQKAQSELIVKLRDGAKIERTEPEVPPPGAPAAGAPAGAATPSK